MSTDESEGAAPEEDAGIESSETSGTGEEETPHFVEVWNDYDPSQRFAAIFPIGDEHGATTGTVGYYIIEPGKHTGVHHDNAEEIAFGSSKPMYAGKFYVFPAGADHDIYARGSVAMRLLSFFPVTEIVSTFQQAIYPMGTTEFSSKPPKPVVQELDPDNLPENFPFSPDELGLGGEAGELSDTQRLLGMTEPGVPPEKTKVTIYSPSEGKVESYTLGRDGKRIEDEAGEPAAEAEPESEPAEG
jgi:hypothetical protein